MSPPPLTLTEDGPVRVLTLSRPELHNRFDGELHAEFIRALRELDSDDSARAIVMASTGKAFSAGGDFELMRRANGDAGTRAEIVSDALELLLSLLSVQHPVIAAVQGPAIGLGATVALGADAIVASRKASFADSHVNVGLVAGDGGSVLWPAAVGSLRARRHLLSGDPLSAEEAERLGMVTDLVEGPEDVLPAAEELAARIAAQPPMAVRLTKRALMRDLLARVRQEVELSLAYEERTLASDDLLEAITAFEEGRPGKYVGR